MGESPLVASDGLAERALEGVTQGMKIGFGAGRTPARAIDLLGVRATAGLDVAVVAASESAEARCRAAGLTVLDFATVEELDLLVDGVDEIDRDMRALKGSGGAMARERIIAWASRRTIYMAGANKVSDRIGTLAALSIAVLPFGLASTRAAIRRVGLNGVVRLDMNGGFFVTDNGNLILDVSLPGDEDFEELAGDLSAIPGVLDHGLFLHEADRVLIEQASGEVEELERA